MSSSLQSRLREWKIDRRRFLYATGGLAGLVATSRLQALAHTGTPSFPSNPFTLGVASGDPAPESVVLWTRLAPEPLAADGHGGMDPVRVPVRWIVAADDRMRHVVRRRRHARGPGLRALRPRGCGPAVARPRGTGISSTSGGEWSPVGRTRTSNPFWESPRRLRFAFASCQHFEHGLLHRVPAHGRRGSRPRAVPGRLHLRGRRVADATAPARWRRADDAWARIATATRCTRATRTSRPPTPRSPGWSCSTITKWRTTGPGRSTRTARRRTLFLPRRAAAFQAYYEHMPLRAASIPRGPDIQLSAESGSVIWPSSTCSIRVSIRDNQACGDGTDIGCAEALDPNRTITGREQERWLLEGWTSHARGGM